MAKICHVGILDFSLSRIWTELFVMTFIFWPILFLLLLLDPIIISNIIIYCYYCYIDQCWMTDYPFLVCKDRPVPYRSKQALGRVEIDPFSTSTPRPEFLGGVEVKRRHSLPFCLI